MVGLRLFSVFSLLIGTFLSGNAWAAATANGTNGADTISVNACDTSCGGDGVQDFTVVVNGGTPSIHLDETDLTVNGLGGNDTLVLNIPASNNAAWGVNVTVNGGAGDDTLKIQGSGDISANVTYDGGDDFDVLEMSNSSTANNSHYDMGADNSSGTVTTQYASSRVFNLSYTNIEPVIDCTLAVTLTVMGTNADNAVNYTAGPGNTCPPTGLVSVDGFETIEFGNKTNLIINGNAGSDTFNLNNPATPLGLTSITIQGQDPTASDTLIINGTLNTMDTIVYTPTLGSPDGGTVTGAQPVPVTFLTTERLIVNGQRGQDTITVNGTVNGDTLTHVPG
ncbi:MAG: hypothetical protein R3257_03255, partial [bacterium]|nr:hypothetical protein [bacterium]